MIESATGDAGPGAGSGELARYFYRPLTFTLEDGRRIRLTRLEQWLTYGELLEGVPRYSPKKIERDLRGVRSKRDSPVVVVDAVPVVLPGHPGVPEWIAARCPHKRPTGEHLALPAVTCFARFESLEGLVSSELGMLWYQDGFALPIAPRALEKIAALDWEANAAEIEW